MGLATHNGPSAILTACLPCLVLQPSLIVQWQMHIDAPRSGASSVKDAASIVHIARRRSHIAILPKAPGWKRGHVATTFNLRTDYALLSFRTREWGPDMPMSEFVSVASTRGRGMGARLPETMARPLGKSGKSQTAGENSLTPLMPTSWHVAWRGVCEGGTRGRVTGTQPNYTGLARWHISYSIEAVAAANPCDELDKNRRNRSNLEFVRLNVTACQPELKLKLKVT